MVAYRPVDWLSGVPADLFRVGEDGSVQKRAGGGRRPQVWKPIRPRINNRSVSVVKLCYRGNSVRRGTGSVVLTAFSGPRPAGHEAFHFPNDDPSDNRLGNLRWAPKGASRIGEPGPHMPGSANPSSKLTEDDAIGIRARRNAGRSLRELAELYGVDPSLISRIARGESWRHIAPAAVGSGVNPPNPYDRRGGRADAPEAT